MLRYCVFNQTVAFVVSFKMRVEDVFAYSSNILITYKKLHEEYVGCSDQISFVTLEQPFSLHVETFSRQLSLHSRCDTERNTSKE